jgi:ribonuclease E
LSGRLTRFTGEGDVFRDLRIDEQLAKALDRKVWLPSGGSLVIDRTEAMTVVDVNTGKFVGSGGNLEQTVTRNNMEAAEEIVRQLRLRDIGGIIVIDFIDMVLESNRDLVLRRLTECLGRDRTKHQVAEVTSLGLVQMTRKRVGQGLLEVFSEPCEHCRGRGVIVSTDPVDERRRGGGPSGGGHAGPGNGGSGNGRRDRSGGSRDNAKDTETAPAETTEEPTAGPTGDGEVTDGARSGGRRNRGRRSRGQSGEERAAEDAAVLAGTAPDEPVDEDTEPTPAESNAVEVLPVLAEAVEDAVAEEVPADEMPVEALAVVVAPLETVDGTVNEVPTAEAPASAPAASVESAEPLATARPRRRRAASRPAGPPVS